MNTQKISLKKVTLKKILSDPQSDKLSIKINIFKMEPAYIKALNLKNKLITFKEINDF
jgi:hypothetical protein